MNWREYDKEPRLIELTGIALALIEIHLPNTPWKFVWDSSVSRFGQCRYGSKEIGISKTLALNNSEKQFIDTVLHEIAHALTPGHNHDSAWKYQAMMIGATPRRCYNSNVIAPKKWKGICPNCGRSVLRHRRKNTACKSCCILFNHGKFSSLYSFVWSDNPS